MSEHEKDNNQFEFIKEQVIEKKHKRIKKLLFPTITTVGFAVLFGVAAAVTFTATQPLVDKILHKDGGTATPVSFPTQYPLDNNGGSALGLTGIPTPEPVIVEKSIKADISDYLSMNKDLQEVADKVNKSILKISSVYAVKDWFGKSVDKTVNTTGVIVYNNTKDLLVLVSYDRIKQAKSIKVEFSDIVSVGASVQDYDSELNLALISVPVKDVPGIYMSSLQTATLGESYGVTVGNPILALGSPNGYAGSMEIGMITSKGSTVSITDNSLELFNTDIEDNKNSDGIIVNLDGEIIGIITRTLKEDNNENLNTVIGISQLKNIITAMGNKEPRVYFGVKTQDLSSAAKTEYNIIGGIYVIDIKAKSPAFKAGLQNGDIIMKVNDITITNTSEFHTVISNYIADKKIRVSVLRMNGTKKNKVDLEVVLSKKEK